MEEKRNDILNEAESTVKDAEINDEQLEAVAGGSAHYYNGTFGKGPVKEVFRVGQTETNS